MDLPHDIRIRLIPKEEANRRPTLMCMLPGLGSHPGILEIQLRDPDDNKLVWIEIPFDWPPEAKPRIVG
jgi:hypothetical protein